MKGKGFDIKAFGIAHGEKIAMGIVGLLVLVILGGTTWGTYKKTPDQLTDKATKAREDVVSSQWPPTEIEKFPTEDRLKVQVDSMLSTIPGDKIRLADGSPGYALSINPSFDLYIKEKPWTTPVYLPVRNLQATSFRPILAMQREIEGLLPSETENPLLMPGGPGGKPVPKQRGGFKNLGGGVAGGEGEIPGAPPGAGGKGLGPVAPMPGGQRPMGGAKIAGKFGAQPGGLGAAVPIGMPPGGGGEMPGMEGGEAGGQYDAVGYRAISVRGVFSIREQARLIEKALNEPEDSLDPRYRVRLASFLLERRSSADNGKSWSEWKEVEVKPTLDVFEKSANWETDIVHQGVTDGEITMPLPMRLLRDWGDEASHPDIDNFKLSERGREIQSAIQEAAQKYAKQMKSLMDVNEKSKLGGLVNNIQRATTEVMGDTTMYSNMMTDVSKRFSQPDMDPTKLKKEIADEISAAGDLLLFRYFDFDVYPGMSYEYRVQLILYNPLYGAPTEKLALNSLDSNKAKYLNTPVSNVTSAVKVERDTNYFVRAVRDSRALYYEEPTVDLEFFQWFPKPGTMVKGNVNGVLAGKKLVGKDKKTERFDPGVPVIEINVETDFASNDVLIDAIRQRTSLDSDHMRELGLDRKLSGLLPVPPEIVVIDETGKMRQLDSLSNSILRTTIAEDHEALLERYKNLKRDPNLKVEGEGNLDMEGMPPGAGEGGDGGGAMYGRPMSPLRRGYGSGKNSASTKNKAKSKTRRGGASPACP